MQEVEVDSTVLLSEDNISDVIEAYVAQVQNVLAELDRSNVYRLLVDLKRKPLNQRFIPNKNNGVGQADTVRGVLVRA